jgi:hypothetical protein
MLASADDRIKRWDWGCLRPLPCIGGKVHEAACDYRQGAESPRTIHMVLLVALWPCPPILHTAPGCPAINSAISLHSSSNSRKWAVSCRDSAENLPCFKRACLDRARPACVRGPVDRPPCIRQRFLPRTAGQAQGSPLRVRAPHREASPGFPGGLPFLSQPPRFAWGSSAVLLYIPTPPVHRPHNGLPSSLYGYVFHGHSLVSTDSVCSQALRHRGKRP